jgi:hypothetical protein
LRRTLLRLTNTLLALLGLAMLGYAVFTYIKWKGAEFPSAVSPAAAPASLQGHPAGPGPAAHLLLQRTGVLRDDDPSPPAPEPSPPAPLPHHRLKFPWCDGSCQWHSLHFPLLAGALHARCAIALSMLFLLQ